MEELNLRELLEYYRKKILIIILTTILAILLGYTYIKYYQVPLYHGTTTIILVQKNDKDNSNTITQSELSTNEKLVATYSEIIKSRSVLEQVIGELDLTITPKDLSKNIEVNPISDTSIIEIKVSDENNKQATNIANKIAEVFKIEITKIYNLENVSVVDEAIIEENPYNINKTKQMALYTIIGILVSCFLIFIMYYFDNTIKNKKEIENGLDLAVIGEIPYIDKSERKRRLKLKRKKEQSKVEEEPLTKESLEKNKDIQEPAIKNPKSKSSTNTSKTKLSTTNESEKAPKTNTTSKKTTSSNSKAKSKTTSENTKTTVKKTTTKATKAKKEGEK